MVYSSKIDMETMRAFQCAHCGVYAKQSWLHSSNLHNLIRGLNLDKVPGNDVSIYQINGIAITNCGHCSKSSVWKEIFVEGQHGMSEMGHTEYELVYPLNDFVSISVDGVPEDILADLNETLKVLPISPKASAALSRRLLQKILRDYLSIDHRDLSRQIDEFIQTKGASTILNQEIDAIRNIGNFAAHPLKSTSTGEILEVEAGEAEWLIEVMQGLLDFAFIQPRLHRERRERLNEKLKDANKPPMKE